MRDQVLIEGYTHKELLAMKPQEFDNYVFTDDPIVFKIGSANILGRFSISDSSLMIELAQIDGGGEGVLPCLLSFARKLARHRSLHEVEWYVHAVACADPNIRLPSLLERTGYVIQDHPQIGEVYVKVDSVAA